MSKKRDKGFKSLPATSDIDVEIYEDLDNGETKSNLTSSVGKDYMELLDEKLKRIKTFSQTLMDPESSFSQRIDQIQRVRISLLVPMLEVLLDQGAYRDELLVVNGIESTLQKIEDSLYNKAEFELQQEIDFMHPKIQKAFSFMVEAMLEVMQEVGINDLAINTFINSYGMRMSGFEQELNARMEGLSATTLDQVENPLMQKFHKAKEGGTSEDRDSEDTSEIEKDIAKKAKVVKKTRVNKRKRAAKPKKGPKTGE